MAYFELKGWEHLYSAYLFLQDGGGAGFGFKRDKGKRIRLGKLRVELGIIKNGWKEEKNNSRNKIRE